MPEGVSSERALMIRAYNGDIRLSPKHQGIIGAIEMAESLGRQLNAFLPRQFENPDNALAHRHGTATEIIEQIPGGRIDAIVSGVGTGGTLVGIFQGLRDHRCPVKPFAVKPVASSSNSNQLALSHCFHDSECSSFSRRIPGLVDKLSKIYKPNELPELVELEILDELALQTTRDLIAGGFPVGPSSGLNYAAAQVAAQSLPPDATIVTVFPDRMERYFSTDLFSIYDAGKTPCL